MAYLLGLSAVLAAYILGRTAMCILYREERNVIWKSAVTDALPVGGMMIIGLAWIAHMIALFMGRSFSDCKKIFLILLGGMLALALVVLALIKRQGTKDEEKVTEAKTSKMTLALCVILGALVLLQVILLVTGQNVYRVGDMTVETVNTMLHTDTLYQINPMTGQAYELGIPLRLKILCLPTLYACLCSIFGMPATEVVWMWVPMFTLLASYLAMNAVARVLFPESRDKQVLFLIFIALVFVFGNYQYGMDGFGLQYAGYRGVTIRGTVLIPYLFACVLRKRNMLVLLCIAAEACVVWTLYGMGACLLIAVLLYVLSVVPALAKKFLHRGKEADA